MCKEVRGQFFIGQVVRHRLYPFRGVIVDVDPEFDNDESWWLSIPEEVRPAKEQPYYHLLAENEDSTYLAYVSQQNLLPDSTGPCHHPDIRDFFGAYHNGCYELKSISTH